MERLGVFVAAMALISSCHASTAVRLRVEYLENPINIDVPQPRFSFACSGSERGGVMTAFQIVVSNAGGQVWDSGKVKSTNSVNIEYAGSPLTSDTDYTWNVIWWDGSDAKSETATGTFSTALLKGAADVPQAQWVAPAAGANLLRAEFSLTGGPKRARLYVSGLGFYHAWVNGVATDDHAVGQFLTFEKRIAYDVVDVTHLVRDGCNAIAISLGTGWYSQHTINVGPKSLWMALSVDGQWFHSALNPATGGLVFTSAPGPVTFDEIYNGENYDARLEQAGWDSCGFANKTEWTPAISARNATESALFVSQKFAVRPDRPYSVVNLTQPRDGHWVFDFGQNMAGITTLRVVCPRGQTISMVYGESLEEDGTVLNQYGASAMRSNFTCAGTGDEEVYTTQFTQYGFRFVEVTNFPGLPNFQTFTAYFIHADLPQTGAFVSSNTLLNQIEHLTRFAALSNQMDIPTDCPQRERRGWLGDAQLSCETNIYNEDMAVFYTKWLFDVRDSQNTAGQVPDCAPYYHHGGQPGDPAWSVAYPAIVDWMASYHNDDRIVATHYDGVKAYIESEIKQLDPTGALSFARYGDWCSAADGFKTGAPFKRGDISTFMFLSGVESLAKFATKLGKTADAAKYNQLAATTRGVYNKLYLHADASSASYSDGYPISQLLALAANVVPAENVSAVVTSLVDSIHSGAHSGSPDHTTGGIIFMKYAFDILQAHGHVTEAVDILLNSGFPSISAWLQEPVPATTLWENWQSTSTKPHGSYNHIMYGGFGAWLYRGLAGLDRASGSRGWQNLKISPPSPANVSKFLTSASADVDTPIGMASVSWNSAPESDDTCVAAAPENSVATFTCTGGTFSSVAFASFGTPTGTCPNGLSVNKACDAANATAKVAAACVGKSSCSISVTDKFFGDPCFDTVKHLAVSLNGSCLTSMYSLQVTIPTNGHATVAVPTEGNSPASLTVIESGKAVWQHGAFVPGTPGITSAATGVGAVVFQVGSGQYDFNVKAQHTL